MADTEFLVVGAGIVGASIAAALSPHARVTIIEAEDVPGYHATGRSAAFWSESYGGPLVQPLTTASGVMMHAGGFLAPLTSLHIGRDEDAPAIDAFIAEFAGTGVRLEPTDPHRFVPGLRPHWSRGVLEASSAYIDVAGLHAHFLGAARRHGANLLTAAPLNAARRDGALWRVQAGKSELTAEVIVNAAGAWADNVARAAGVATLGISPFRRTMVQLRTDPPNPASLPHVIDINGGFYFKPEGEGRLWLSPHDEIPDQPGDAQPEDIDVAIAIDRLEQCVDWRVAAVERKWAGLRSFAPDRLPVYGFDRATPGFFWAAGQGGFGIQTAAAAADMAAALALGRTPEIARTLDVARYAPSRFAVVA